MTLAVIVYFAAATVFGVLWARATDKNEKLTQRLHAAEEEIKFLRFEKGGDL